MWFQHDPKDVSHGGIKIVELTESNTCKFCDNALGKYSCPRCNLKYCSLTCYQSEKHLNCSELFYKECVLQNLDKNDEAAKKKMMEILEGFHNKNKLNEDDIESGEEETTLFDDDDDEYETEESLDSDDELSEMFKNIGERMAGIDLDDSEEVWGNLNEEERQEFESFLLSGDVGQYITMWTPWWAYRCERRCIEVTELDEQKAKCPKIIENIKPFEEISSKPPKSGIEHNLVNIIAAYAFTLRYFNGDHCDFIKETATCIYNLSLHLKKDQEFGSFNEAVAAVTTASTQPELNILADRENVEYVKTDVQMILSGPHATEKKYYLLCALSDLLELFSKALTEDSKSEGTFYKKFTENQQASMIMIKDDDLKKATQRIEYFLSFVKYLYS